MKVTITDAEVLIRPDGGGPLPPAAPALTAAGFLDGLARRGGRARLEGDRVLVSPGSALTGADRAWLRENRGRLIAHLASPPDDVLDAVAERAYHDEPDWSAGPVALRESVVIRCPGFPTVAMSPADADAFLKALARRPPAQAATAKKGPAGRAEQQAPGPRQSTFPGVDAGEGNKEQERR